MGVGVCCYAVDNIQGRPEADLLLLAAERRIDLVERAQALAVGAGHEKMVRSHFDATAGISLSELYLLSGRGMRQMDLPAQPLGHAHGVLNSGVRLAQVLLLVVRVVACVEDDRPVFREIEEM